MKSDSSTYKYSIVLSLLFYLLLGELSAAVMSEKGRKIDKLKEEFNITNWATWHLAMQGPMLVAKATALAF